MLPSLLRKQNNKLRVVPKQKGGMTMKKKMIALTCSLIFANTIPVFAASDYGINIDQKYVSGDASQLSDAISESLNDMGVKKVSSYDLEKKEDSQTVAQVILSADGVAMEAVCYYTKDNTWSCSSITNIHSSSDDLIYYWVNPVSADATAFEIKDYKTGEYKPEGAAEELLSQYENQEKWFSLEDFKLYDKNDAPIEIPDSEDHIMASAYPDSKTFRGIKIGDTISNLFSAYDSKYFSVQVGYDDTTATDAQKKLVEMYNAQIEAADPEDIESTISSIDSSAVSVVVLFEGAEFCGKIIPKPEPNSGKSVSYKVSEDIGFIIDNDKISDIGIQRGGRY